MPEPADLRPSPVTSRRRWLSVGLYVVGVLLLGGALVWVWREGATLRGAWGQAARAPAWMVAALLLLPLASWCCTTALFLVLTRRHGRVGTREMGALIGAAWLLNYLPLRPGMVGRVAYHKAVNGIRVRDSVRVVAQAIACTAAAAIALAATAGTMGAHTWLLGLPLVAVAAAAFVVRWRWVNRWAPYEPPLATRLLWAVGIRYVDMAIWSARYWLAFGVIGAPLPFDQAALVAAVAQVAMLAPIALGVREWVVGLFSAVTVVGLAADVVNRAAEIVGAIPVGLLSLAWLSRRAQGRALARGQGATSQNPAGSRTADGPMKA
ncbi:MAG: hypothetical protein ACKVS8_14710 [Phycisphaerales bacterium]